VKPRRKYLIETPHGTIEVATRRGRRVGPNRYRWQFRAKILSGPAMSDDDWRRRVDSFIADLVSQGIDVVGWDSGHAPEEG
jgi:hypothetical protein